MSQKGTVSGNGFTVRPRYAVVFVKKGEQWRIVAEHAMNVGE
jgi:hypothetical protein